MKKHLKKVVIASSIVLASGSVIVSSMNRVQAPLPERGHQDLWAANSAPSGHRSALPAPKPKYRGTPVRIQDPFEKAERGQLRKKTNTVPNSQKAKGRKPISAKDEFMPDIIDIPTAANDGTVFPQPVSQQSRWIKELSGKNARIQMAGVRKKLDNCDQDHLAACAHHRNDPSITVAGIVVQTDSTTQSALEAKSLQGEMGRGSYAEGKPLVYLK